MDATVARSAADARRRVPGLGPARVEAHLLARDAVLVDVRETGELREEGRIAGCVHAPQGVTGPLAAGADPARPSGLDPDRRTIVYCDTGDRSILVADQLRRRGHRDVAYLEGGLRAWTAAGLPVVGLASWHRDVGAPAGR